MSKSVFSVSDKSTNRKCVIVFISLILSSVPVVDCRNVFNVSRASGYDNIKSLQDAILSSANYSTNLRPVNDQIKTIVIRFVFSLVAVVAVDNVKQEMITNGFMFFMWDDERLTWNPDDYGGVDHLTPKSTEIWHPYMFIINTLDHTDPFKNEDSHLEVSASGRVNWAPGGLFHTYCALDIQKFPFDVQTCLIQMLPMSLNNHDARFEAENVDLAFFEANPGWELLEAAVTVNPATAGDSIYLCPTFKIQLKRRPATIVLNVIIPVILLSILNNFVFLIPVDSGEKISYAINVLLSLTVFLSMVSTMTPQVSYLVPSLTIYLFVLLLLSVLTVVAAIASVHLHNLNEKEELSIKNKLKFQNCAQKIIALNTTLISLETGDETCQSDQQNGNPIPHHKRIIDPGHNPYRMVTKHINKVLFVVMNSITSFATVYYLVWTNT